MKLKFSIQYATQWGESLHVVLSFYSTDGAERRQNLPMTTDDGQQWTLDTSMVASRQRPVTRLCYYYQVETADGQVVRREWTLVGRCYAFDASKSYVFDDQWRDMPLNYHLYTSAYLVTQGMVADEECRPLTTPLYRRTVLFRVSAPQLLEGQSVALVGSHPALGSWNAARFLRMEPMGQHEWLLSVNVDMVVMPLEYKYVVVNDATSELVAWEEGDNRVLDVPLVDGQVLVVYGQPLRLREAVWRAAGVAVPVFSLRSEHSFGVGDFGDLLPLVDWAVQTGMKVIQLLPVNDTTTDGLWHDSYPYNITSCFALHPHYLDLSQLGTLKNRQHLTSYRRRQRELNALSFSDYEAVHRVKSDYAAEAFADYGEQVLSSRDYKSWAEANEWWLTDYVEWCVSTRSVSPDFLRYVQYNLHLQLKRAADYARSHGVLLKGDVPIGVSRNSAETAAHPQLFNLDGQTGAPPDAFSPQGQNWGFPTYRWESARETGGSEKAVGLTEWLRRRFEWMSQYFDAVRIDHILGYFRVWELPSDAVDGLLGHFSPSLPLTSGEIAYFGLPFRRELLTKPFINDRVLERLFGIHAQYVREHFLENRPYGLYAVKSEYDTQQKVVRHFEGRRDENSLWIREGMMRLLTGVLFVEDPRQPDMYHPRVNAWQEPVFDALSDDEKDAYMRLYNNYYYQRHTHFWGQSAQRRLSEVLSGCRMLVCGEDLGQLPDCVSPVLDRQRVLTLEVQSLPKQSGYEFAHLEGYPQLSVATISTHDMSPLRLWWEEHPERTQRYWVTMLQKEGRAPVQLPAHVAEEIVARHLYCPSMLCVLALQDWLAVDASLRRNDPRQERINTPGDPYNRWQWRMHVTLEQLLEATRYNAKLKTMIARSKR